VCVCVCVCVVCVRVFVMEGVGAVKDDGEGNRM
jgi:hypothetical protein